jgi:hypothetical protein
VFKDPLEILLGVDAVGGWKNNGKPDLKSGVIRGMKITMHYD